MIHEVMIAKLHCNIVGVSFTLLCCLCERAVAALHWVPGDSRCAGARGGLAQGDADTLFQSLCSSHYASIGCSRILKILRLRPLDIVHGRVCWRLKATSVNCAECGHQEAQEAES